jgi:L-alanine-DL-glutamate epimerase-like enolase superfamily enzyme
LRDNLIAEPSLEPDRGQLSLAGAPGLGFQLDREAIADAAARFGRDAG